MKNLKKILALAIAFVMCFTMFAGALVFSDVPAGGDYSAAITLLSDLGVIAGKPDGSFGINDAITRADAVCLIARLMTGEQNPPKYNNAPVFTDVVPGSYYESSVGYCAALGITSGTGNGQFSPSKTITDGEFVAMLTRALGYDTPEHPLQWPMGNIVVAQQKGLLKNVNIEYASDALRGEDAQMLANALFADYDAWAAKQNLYQRADDQANPTIAEVVFNLGRLAYDNDESLKMEDSVFFTQVHKKVYNDEKNSYNVAQDCQAHTWVIAGVDAHAKENTYVAYAISDDDNKVVDPTTREIRTKGSEKDEWAYQTFEYSGDITPYIGYQVELWGELDHVGKIKEVAAIRTIEGQQVYDYNASMDDGDDNDKLKFDDKTLVLKDSNAGMADLQLKKDNWQSDNYEKVNGIERVYKLRRGHADTQVGESDLNIKDGDQFKLFDWDNDGDIDFVVRDTAKYAIVDDLTSKRIVLGAIDKKPYPVDKSEKTDENITKSLELDNADLVINADGVEKGDIVEITIDSRVYTKADEETVTITLTPVDPDVHKLTKVSTKGDLASYFDEERFHVANGGFWDLTEAKDAEDYDYDEQDLNRDFDLFLDRNGFIVYSRYSDGDRGKYMMVMETQDGGGRISAHHLPAIKALLENDKVATFDTIEKLKIYEANGRDPINAYSSDTFKFTDTEIVGRVFKYYTNSKGEITKLVAATSDADVTTGRYRTATVDPDYTYNEKSMSLAGAGTRWNFEDAQAVFVVRSEPVNANGVAVDPARTYIESYQEDGDTRLRVDRANVIAVKASEIPDIAVGKTVEPRILDAVDKTGYDSYETWIDNTKVAGPPVTYTGKGYQAIIGYSNDNNDVKVAILGVDSFEGFGRNSVSLALLREVSSKRVDDDYVYTFTMAVDGKTEAEYSSEAVDDLNDVVSQYNATSGKKTSMGLGSKTELDQLLEDKGLAYAEVRFDGEIVDEVVLLDAADLVTTGVHTNGSIYTGEYFNVTRAVVGDKQPDKILQFNVGGITFANKEDLTAIERWDASAYFVGLTSDTEFYSIDQRPTIRSGFAPARYAGAPMLITNDFDDPATVEAMEGGAADIAKSIIYANNNDDDYSVVDVATEKTADRAGMNTKDAVAVLYFEKYMGEANIKALRGIRTDGKPEIVNPSSGQTREFQLLDENDEPVLVTTLEVNDEPGVRAEVENGNIVNKQSPQNVKSLTYDGSKITITFNANAVAGVYTIKATGKGYDDVVEIPVRVSTSTTVVADKSNVTINVAQGTTEQWPSITLVDPTAGKAPLASAFEVAGKTEGTDYKYDRATGVLSFKQPAWSNSQAQVVYVVKDKATTPNTVATVTINYGSATTDPFENATVADAYVGDTVVVISGVTSEFTPTKSELSVTVGSTKVDISSVDSSDAADGNLTIYLDDPLPAGQLVVESSSVANYADSQTEAVDVALRTEDEIAIEDPVTAGIAGGKDEDVSTQAGAIYKVCKDLTVAKTTVNNNGSVTIKFSGKVDLSAAGKDKDEAWPSYGGETTFGNSVILPVEFPWFEGANGHKWDTTPTDRGPFTYKLNGNGGTVIAFPIAEGKITTARKTLRWFADDVCKTPDASGFEVLTGATKKIAEVTYVFDFSDVELTEISGS